MSMKAGFAETDISPPLGALKVGWIKEIVIEAIHDPIFARAAVFQTDDERIGFVQLDTICIRREEVERIRQGISAEYGFPGENVMVASTHNHAGPAVDSLGEVPIDLDYVETMVQATVSVFGEALAGLQEAQIGMGSATEWGVSHNRRVVLRDGTVQTHTGYASQDLLYIEGPIDPEVCVLTARSTEGKTLGALANFACHPTHHGDDEVLSAGFPGVLAAEMKSRGCPVTLFLNGAAGNLSPGNPVTHAPEGMEEIGGILAAAVERALKAATYQDQMRMGVNSVELSLPYRAVNEDEIRGTVRGAQRFVNPEIYDRFIPAVLDEIERNGTQKAEVQALSFGDHVYVAIPGEYFVQLGFRVKEGGYPRRVHLVGFANGYVGYIPHRAAIERGGYETTFGWGSKLAPEAGDLLADAAITLIGQGLMEAARP